MDSQEIILAIETPPSETNLLDNIDLDNLPALTQKGLHHFSNFILRGVEATCAQRNFCLIKTHEYLLYNFPEKGREMNCQIWAGASFVALKFNEQSLTLLDVYDGL